MAKRRLTKRQQARIAQNQVSKSPTVIDAAIENTLQAEQDGFVVAHFGTQVLVQSTGNTLQQQRAHLRANTAALVVGDNVRWQAGAEIGVVNRRQPRRNVLERPDHRGKPRAVAANIEKLFIVIAPEPTAHTNFIDRYIVACKHHNMEPVLVLNKIDQTGAALTRARTIVQQYRNLGYTCLELSSKTGTGIAALRATIDGHQVMLAGQSGVGKSSLTNALIPHTNTAVGSLSHAASQGRHTTTASHWYAVGNGGLIDSPGIREFSLNHLSRNDILAGFKECQNLLGQCQFRDCSHQNAKGCAIIAAAENGNIPDTRLKSLYVLLNECDQNL